jgi:predicted nucleotidyltransferase
MHSLEAKYVEIVRQIVLRSVDVERFAVFLFGSRAQGAAHSVSDIDIGIWGDEEFPRRKIARIKEELEECVVPYHVDIIDFSTVSDEFKRVALHQIEPWNLPKHSSASLTP